MVSEAIRHQLYALKTARFTPVASSSWENRPGQTHAGFKSPFLYIILILVIKDLSGFSLPSGAIHLPSCATVIKNGPDLCIHRSAFSSWCSGQINGAKSPPKHDVCIRQGGVWNMHCVSKHFNTLTWEHVHSPRSYTQLGMCLPAVSVHRAIKRTHYVSVFIEAFQNSESSLDCPYVAIPIIPPAILHVFKTSQ